MLLGELAALGAALCWATAGMVSLKPARALGAIPFNRLRMLLVFVMLAVLTSLSGGWQSIAQGHLVILILSGLIGILIGDTFLFATLRRLGPRRCTILFAANAPMTVLLGLVLLGETLNLWQVGGCALVFIGVVLAIAFGTHAQRADRWDEIQGSLAWGIGFGLLAALCQALGTVLAKPVIDAGADPIAASALRVGVAALGLATTFALRGTAYCQQTPLSWQLTGQIALSGFLGMALGMSLLLFALAYAATGVAATLSSTSPVLMLPLIWLSTGICPRWAAWLGAILSSTGTSLILLNPS